MVRSNQRPLQAPAGSGSRLLRGPSAAVTRQIKGARTPGRHCTSSARCPLQDGQERPGRTPSRLRPAAEDRRVERDDERLAPAALGARHEALDELVRGAPVELEPARAVAESSSATRSIGVEAWFEKTIGMPWREWRAAPPAGSGGRHGARSRHADRASRQGRRPAAAEECDSRVALRHVAQHPRHDPPGSEALAVVADRLARAGAGGDVGPGAPRHRLARSLLEMRGVGGHLPAAAA